MKKYLVILLVCSPLAALAVNETAEDDTPPAGYMFAYERPGMRTPAGAPARKKQKLEKVGVQPKKKIELKQRP